ncbi:uncharacterized protein DUF1501 [Prosthecobacter fusiformis]|uniref:Uncharacterized protein DUF1501 n=1 Tax=Prosthecobacter fusiformis TaxID=48464 RepID=A0A4R7RMH2_9BACT|nr:DUF1501 domain-containing protein [Prosthecobacter fusiformis]TDU66584.1 uncharacterized protein DUF1501 [Prosthecobacter fusiformis]
MPPPHDPLLQATRRHFFSQCGMGIGSVALASMMAERGLQAASAAAQPGPGVPARGNHPAKAKNVIFLFMAGGPSQLELFDYKPVLQKLNGQPIPQSYIEGKRFAFMGSSHGVKLLGTRKEFKQRGQCGTWVSEMLPYTAGIVDDISVVTTCQTTLFNHAPAKLFMNTGSGQFGRPSMGSWLTYGIGSESSDLPGFVVLQSGPRGPRGGAVNWSSGFLPTTYQGVPLRSQGEPILNLTTPASVDARSQRRVIDAVRDMNMKRLVTTGDDEIQTRINAYEMAYRMQSSAPELIDIQGESKATLDLYGVDPTQPSFARNCLLARRLVERGVRFVQLYHTNWDSHGGKGETLEDDFPKVVHDVDQGCAALIRDLKSRGLLEETLVIWGGEFGRTPMGENREKTGRNHHIDAFTMWFAGGGIKPGQTYGRTDELGFDGVEQKAHVHDIHATLLHLMGLDHEKLTFKFQGRDFRLTDVHGEILQGLLA